MKHRSNHLLLNYRTPSNPAGLRFIEGAPEGGAVAAPEAPQPTDPAASKQEDPQPLGEGGKKALQTERDARKALEKELQDLKSGQKAQMDALAEAFGVKKSDSKDGGDVIASLQQQMADMQRANLIHQIALEHGVTEADDIALIEAASSEDGMRRIADRIKSSTDATPGTPKPDRSQGGQGGQGTEPEVKPGVDRITQGITKQLAKS